MTVFLRTKAPKCVLLYLVLNDCISEEVNAKAAQMNSLFTGTCSQGSVR